MQIHRHKGIAMVLAVLLATAPLASCSTVTDTKGGVMHIAATPALDFTESPSAVSGDIAESANDFAFRFAQALLDESEPDANFLCSPYSAWLPLAALANATDAQRQPELLRILGAAGLSASQLNTAASDMLAALTEERNNRNREEEGLEPHNPLSIANAIFVDQEARLNSDFAQTFARDYSGAAMSVDFASDEAADAINTWAAEQTDGLIPEIVSPGTLDPETAAAIANAIYFSDRWEWEFSEDDTVPGDFHTPDGTAAAQFMRREGEQPYYEDSNLQAVQLDFATGGSLLVLLPKDGDAAALLQEMNEARLQEILFEVQNREGLLKLPRFEVHSGVMSLSGVLEALEVPLLDATDPPLDALVDGESLYLSQAVQSATIRVDEKGTTAAAVTVVMTTGTALPEPTAPFEMVCDSPFVFILLGDSAGGSQQVLFTGVVNDPAAGTA